ncbi:biotin--[acetyl-CoA-carboxylase] ligase [Noviherbaspirillum massiliense]|uniref:biotin--[acetyl-CoA-carboxylase] ligase n=1 Tax=Noviherbaspirillum massiliense TaxID=1465823 RepID=UPI000316E233|nr:biotin--[acetyl-CoA-carboxylase] ligase [Noviherbaspirillum massiliense]
MTNRLSSQGIAALRQGAAEQVAVEVVAQTGSTNADLLARLGSLRQPTLLIAEEQTAGRGRAGRTWYSAPGASLTFSLAWRFGLPLRSLVGLPLAVGVAIAEALATYGVNAQLKWPNDILLEGKKLAGILIESAVDAHDTASASWAVVGVGINLALDGELAARIGRPAAEVPGLMQTDRDSLMAVLLNKLAQALARFESEGLAAFIGQWNALHAYAGQAVCILDQGRVLHEGLAVGVDETGRFLLETVAGRIAVMAGDISLRVKED